MRNIKRRFFLIILAVLFLLPNPAYAALYDYYYKEKTTNYEKDYTVLQVATNNKALLDIGLKPQDYYQQGFDYKYYLAKDISDYKYSHRKASAKEIYANIDAYIMVGDTNLIEEIVKLNTPKLSKDRYTDQSYQAYQEALNEFIKLKGLRFVKEKDYELKKQNLESAFANLEEKVVDKSRLQALKDSAETKDENNYTSASFQELSKAIENANKVLADSKATYDEIAEAVRNLENALAGLREAKKIAYIVNPRPLTLTLGRKVNEYYVDREVYLVFEDGSRERRPVKWDLDSLDPSIEGTQTISGQVYGTDKKASLTIIYKKTISTEALSATMYEARQRLRGELTSGDRLLLADAIAKAEKVYDNYSNDLTFYDESIQNEIDLAEADLRRVLDNLSPLAEITNLKPDKDINLQPGQEIEISFDSKPGGTANYIVNVPIMTTYSMNTNSQANMKEEPAGSGHYVGKWTAPMGTYGSNFEVVVSLDLPDGQRLKETAQGRINITNNFTVNFKIGNEIIDSQTGKAGDPVKVISNPKRPGYTFSHWELDGERVDLSNLTINSNMDIVAIMKANTNLSYRVRYLDNKGNILAEEKTVADQEYGQVIKEKPLSIPGYNPLEEEKEIKIGSSDELVFIYEPKTDISYTVKYMVGDQEIQEAETKYGIYKEVNQVEAPEIEGYRPLNKYLKFTLDQIEGYTLIASYEPRTDIPYVIKHIEILEDGNEILKDQTTGIGTFGTSIPVNAKNYIGLKADKPDQTINLNSVDNNEVVFKYRELTGITYTINYTNRQDESWSVTIPAHLGEKINKATFENEIVENDGVYYLIEAVKEDQITIDDRSDLNIFNVDLVRYYPIDKTPELKALVDKAQGLTRPSYSKSSSEWDKYWTMHQDALKAFTSAILTEDNLDQLKADLEDTVEIIESISDYDIAWKDRKSPKGFAKTINDQAQQPHVYGRLKVYVNQYSDTINIGMSKEQQEKTFIAGGVSVGLKTAMLNVLKSENLVKVESRGVPADIVDEDGNRKSDDALMEEGAKLALKWLPKGSYIYEDTWATLIDQPTTEFIMTGRTKNGREFTRIYYFDFKDMDDM